MNYIINVQYTVRAQCLLCANFIQSSYCSSLQRLWLSLPEYGRLTQESQKKREPSRAALLALSGAGSPDLLLADHDWLLIPAMNDDVFYVDDILCVWTGNEPEIHSFLQELNKIDPAMALSKPFDRQTCTAATFSLFFPAPLREVMAIWSHQGSSQSAI